MSITVDSLKKGQNIIKVIVLVLFIIYSPCITNQTYLSPFAQSAGAVEYTDCTAAEG